LGETIEIEAVGSAGRWPVEVDAPPAQGRSAQPRWSCWGGPSVHPMQGDEIRALRRLSSPSRRRPEKIPTNLD
jgi:hypothetical protein